ncbi:MAG TPA: D-alanyl-D-alanine carboxypeptidase/D-alanyl-D-alanine-endopeptidase, partial [Stenomitos sp.]
QALGQPLRLQWLSPTLPSGLRVINRTLTVKASDPEFHETILDGDQLVVQSRLHLGADADTIEVPIARPGLFFLERFRAILLGQGIQVGQIALAAVPGDRSTPIATLPFPPLSTLLAETNQKSNNFYAEALLRLLGVTRAAKLPPSQPSGSTLEQGLRRMQEHLAKVGVDPQGYQLVDGSGLSRQNLSSPRALVQTLIAMDRSPYAQAFRSSLTVAGTSGTLRQRFQGTVVVNNLLGKTGTLKGTAALSGYLNVPADRPTVFSIIANQSTQSSAVLRQAIDQIVMAIAQQPNAKNCTVFTPLSTALVSSPK